MKLEVSIIIVSWNTQGLLRECLKSVYCETNDLLFDVYVVDNASHDGTVEMIRKEFPQVHLIANTENVGWGRANNQAVRISQGYFIIFLNPDTVVLNNALKKLVDFCKSNPRVGIAGCKTYNTDRSIQMSWQFFPSLLNTLTNGVTLKTALSIFSPFRKLIRSDVNFTDRITSYSTPKTSKVECVNGHIMITNRDVLNKIGLFDENVFMFDEETDLCWRATLAGWEVWFYAEAEIIHHEKQSRIQRPAEEETKWFIEARSHFYAKNHGLLHRIIFHAVLILGSLLKIFMYIPFFLLDLSRRDYFRNRIHWHWHVEKWHLGKIFPSLKFQDEVK